MAWLKSLRLPIMMLLGGWLIGAFATSALAAPELNLPPVQEPQPVELPSMVWLFVKMVFSLAVIAGLAFLMVRFLKKNLQPPAAGEWINIIDQYPLGLNRGIFLAEIAGKAYILGVTDHNINILGEYPDSEGLAEIKRQVQAREQLPPAAQSLWKGLVDFLGQKGKGRPRDFHSHILKQIQRLQAMTGSSPDPGKREGDRHE